VRSESYYPDRVRPLDADICIAGMEGDREYETTHAGRSIRSRLSTEQHPKPERCRPRPGLTAMWTTVNDPGDPYAMLTPEQVARQARADYRRAWLNLSPTARAEHEARMARRAERRNRRAS